MTAPRLSAGGMIAGKYTVRSMLGNGGATITYHCVSQSGQEVAVKLYDPAVASHATVMKSLEQAYAATNALPQNSAAAIIDAGYDQPTLAPFSVTDLIRLPSLGAQQRRFGPEEVVAMLNGLGRSLDLAHLRQVVHGAIKPTNVFVGPSMNPVVVSDFAANLPKAAAPTQEGYIGSAPWIAPEQAQSGTVTPAADIFSAGLLCFYALTGRSYWRSCQQQFDLAAWQQELGASRMPPSLRAAEIGVPLSPSLDMALCKAISSDPNERFRSIGEFASELEASLTRQQQVGSAATMALPMIGDAPSPLPSNMRNPERAPMPVSNTGATMAFPVEALLGPNAVAQMSQQMGMGPSGAPMGGHSGGQQIGGQQMGGPQMGPAGQLSPGGYDQGYGSPGGYGGAQGGPGANGGWDAANGQAQGYGGGQGLSRDQGYPPPPQPNGGPPVVQSPQKGSKVVPVVIGFTAVALLGAIATVVVLKWQDINKPADAGPTTVPAASAVKDAGTAAATTPEPTASAVASASNAPKFPVKIACAPACDEVKVNGEKVDEKTLTLAAGTYDVEVTKAGYVSQTEKVVVKEGSKSTLKTFLLKKEPPAASTAAVAAPPNTAKPVTTSKPPTGGGGKPPAGGKNCKKVGFITKCT